MARQPFAYRDGGEKSLEFQIMRKIDLTWWCHNALGPQWGIDKFIDNAQRLGACGIELTPPEHWGALKRAGLACPVGLLDYPDGTLPFLIGWNSIDDREKVLLETKRQIQLCKESQGVCGAVIAFSGNRLPGQDEETAVRNCVEGIQLVLREARDADVVILFEHLNDRPVENEPEYGKGWRCHPGYDANSVQYALKVVKGVDSPHCQLLLDLYHLDRSDGDFMTQLEQALPFAGHIHVAGNGQRVRGELNRGKQTRDWGQVFDTIWGSGYDKIIGVEYIPEPGAHYGRDLGAAKKIICRT